MSTKKFVALALMAHAFTACSDGEAKETKRAGKNLAEESGLVRDWKSECDTFGPLNSSGSATYDFKLEDYRKTVSIFSDANCGTPSAEIVCDGSYAIGGSEDLAEGLRRIDLTVEPVSVKPLTEAGAAALNTLNLCGVSDFKVNVARDLTDAARNPGCVLEHTGATQYDVFSRDGDLLKFGSAYLLVRRKSLRAGPPR